MKSIIGPIRSQAPNTYTIGRSESASPLSGRYYFLDLTSTVHDLQTEPVTTKWIRYLTCRKPEDSRDGNYRYQDSTSMSLTEPA